MKQIPFVPNHKDDMHCVNAVYRMVHQYFFHTDLSWEEIDLLSKAITGKATWTFVASTEFAKKGLTVVNIEPVDYKKLYDQGILYFDEVFGRNTAKYYKEKSNINSVISIIPEFLKKVHHETRRATTDEIILYLEKGCLIGAEINSHILNNVSGFGLHFVLLYDYDGTCITLHDPGLPPIQGRRVTITEFEKCFNYSGANGEITIFNK